MGTTDTESLNKLAIQVNGSQEHESVSSGKQGTSLCQSVTIWANLISCACSLLFASCQEAEAVLYACWGAPHPGMLDGLATATGLSQSSLPSEGLYCLYTKKPSLVTFQYLSSSFFLHTIVKTLRDLIQIN